MLPLVTIAHRHLPLALLALLSLTRCPAQETHPADPAAREITTVLSAQQTAWNHGDIRAFMDGYWNSPDLTFSGSSGVSRGWQAVFTRYQQRYPTQAAMGHLDFSALEIRSLGASSALVLGKWHLSLASGDVGGVFTLVFEQFPEGWKIIHDHTSPVPPKQP
jgi:beta-aspartyl-peptidase (threonine type)